MLGAMREGSFLQASQDMNNVAKEVKSQQEQYVVLCSSGSKSSSSSSSSSSKATTASRGGQLADLPYLRRYDSADDLNSHGQLAAIFQVPFDGHSTFEV